MAKSNGAEAHESTNADVPRTSLKAILESLPEGTLLPAGWLLERMAQHQLKGDDASAGTLSAQEFGDLRDPARSADWVREKCAQGAFEGAFKDGGEWRVPRAALTQEVLRSSRSNRDMATGETAMRAGRQGAPAHARWSTG